MSDDRVTTEVIDELELQSLKALVKLAAEGNATAASGALNAIQRIREKGTAGLHAERMAELADKPVELCAYLGWLGLTGTDVAARLGRRLTRQESEAWEQACEDRLLEVRAIELGRMRASGDVPRWATKKTK